MLHIDTQDRLEPISGTENRTCALCEARRATWRGATKDGAEDVVMCAWCVLYGGSAWGHENRNEVLASGIRIRQAALTSRNPKVHVPELDERHRLTAEDAEKLMLGVGYTSAHLRSKLAPIIARERSGEAGG